MKLVMDQSCPEPPTNNQKTNTTDKDYQAIT
jgi:hypothetical protein